MKKTKVKLANPGEPKKTNAKAKAKGNPMAKKKTNAAKKKNPAKRKLNPANPANPKKRRKKRKNPGHKAGESGTAGGIVGGIGGAALMGGLDVALRYFNVGSPTSRAIGMGIGGAVVGGATAFWSPGLGAGIAGGGLTCAALEATSNVGTTPAATSGLRGRALPEGDDDERAGLPARRMGAVDYDTQRRGRGGRMGAVEVDMGSPVLMAPGGRMRFVSNGRWVEV